MSFRVPPAQGTAPVEWYEGSVVPALSVLESLIAPYGTGHEQSALQAACRHLSPLCIKVIKKIEVLECSFCNTD